MNEYPPQDNHIRNSNRQRSTRLIIRLVPAALPTVCSAAASSTSEKEAWPAFLGPRRSLRAHCVRRDRQRHITVIFSHNQYSTNHFHHASSSGNGYDGPHGNAIAISSQGG